MKNLIFASLILISCGVLGGEKRGPGNPVEAGFKDYAIKLSTNLTLLPNSLKQYLKFDSDSLLAQAAIVGGVCATDEELVVMQQRKKLAFTFGKEPNIVTLDCSGYQDGIPPVWKEVFNGNDTETNIFMLHEIFRTMGVEDEKTYSSSGSLSVVEIKMRNAEAAQIRGMLRDKSDYQKPFGVCNVSLYRDARWNNAFLRRDRRIESEFTSVTIWVGGRLESSYEYDVNLAVSLKLDLLNPNRDRTSIAEGLVKELRTRSCFNY